MITVNDWYNEKDVILDIDRDTFIGWYYNHDYSKVYIETDSESLTWCCIQERLL